MMFGPVAICDPSIDAAVRVTGEKLSFLQATEKRITEKILMRKRVATLSAAQACTGFFILKVLGVHLKMKVFAYGFVAVCNGTVSQCAGSAIEYRTRLLRSKNRSSFNFSYICRKR